VAMWREWRPPLMVAIAHRWSMSHRQTVAALRICRIAPYRYARPPEIP